MKTVNYWQSRKAELYSDTSEIPYALPIIINIKNATNEDALLASVQGVARFLLQEETVASPSIDPWLASNIRKVVRRAKDEKSWTKVESLPGLTIIVNETQVRVLFPHSTTETPVEIKRLQVSGLELPTRTQDDALLTINPHALKIAINPELEMTTGKLMAQVGHIAQVVLSLATEEEITKWIAEEFPVIFSDDWATETHMVIHDAGYTEIPANSATVKAFF